MKQVRKRAFEVSSKTFLCYKTDYSKPALYRFINIQPEACTLKIFTAVIYRFF